MTLTAEEIQRKLDALGDGPEDAAQRLELSIRLADLLADRDIARAEALGSDVLRLARLAGSTAGEAHAVRIEAVLRYRAADYIPALTLALQARELFERCGDRAGRAAALALMASIKFKTGDFPGSLELNGQALALFDELGDGDGSVRAHNAAGACHERLGDTAAAMGHYQEALRRAAASTSSGTTTPGRWAPTGTAWSCSRRPATCGARPMC